MFAFKTPLKKQKNKAVELVHQQVSHMVENIFVERKAGIIHSLQVEDRGSV